MAVAGQKVAGEGRLRGQEGSEADSSREASRGFRGCCPGFGDVCREEAGDSCACSRESAILNYVKLNTMSPQCCDLVICRTSRPAILKSPDSCGAEPAHLVPANPWPAHDFPKKLRKGSIFIYFLFLFSQAGVGGALPSTQDAQLGSYPGREGLEVGWSNWECLPVWVTVRVHVRLCVSMCACACPCVLAWAHVCPECAHMCLCMPMLCPREPVCAPSVPMCACVFLCVCPCEPVCACMCPHVPVCARVCPCVPTCACAPAC